MGRGHGAYRVPVSLLFLIFYIDAVCSIGVQNEL